MHLGIVTYEIAAEWDLDTLIEKCRTLGIDGAELRTTHAHGVEPTLSRSQRAEVMKKLSDAGVTLWGLGTTCEFDAVDEAEVRRNIDECRKFAELASDVGARGVKVRPNCLHEDEGIPKQKTLEQIGAAFAECGAIGAEHGIEVWMEVHGVGTQEPTNMRVIMDAANHENCFVCWNSNMADLDENGRIDDNFALLAKWIRSVHMPELSNEKYPWRRLFELLKQIGYGDRFTLAEIPASPEPDRLLGYYRALWEEKVMSHESSVES